MESGLESWDIGFKPYLKVKIQGLILVFGYWF